MSLIIPLILFRNPTPTLTQLIPLYWLPVTASKWHYLELDTMLRISTRPFHDRMAFLNLFYKKNERYQKGYKSESSSARHVRLDVILLILFVVRYLMQLV